VRRFHRQFERELVHEVGAETVKKRRRLLRMSASAESIATSPADVTLRRGRPEPRVTSVTILAIGVYVK